MLEPARNALQVLYDGAGVGQLRLLVVDRPWDICPLLHSVLNTSCSSRSLKEVFAFMSRESAQVSRVLPHQWWRLHRGAEG